MDTGNRYGMGVPISILRGSKIKKIVDREFDKLPLFNRGWAHTEKYAQYLYRRSPRVTYPLFYRWWRGLGFLLKREGYIKGMYVHICSTHNY